jgi:hypothetical protein
MPPEAGAGWVVGGGAWVVAGAGWVVGRAGLVVAGLGGVVAVGAGWGGGDAGRVVDGTVGGAAEPTGWLVERCCAWDAVAAPLQAAAPNDKIPRTVATLSLVDFISSPRFRNSTGPWELVPWSWRVDRRRRPPTTHLRSHGSPGPGPVLDRDHR